MRYPTLTPIGAALLGAAMMWMPQQALASTSAGTVLTNSVTVDYKDGGGTAQTQLTTSVDVTVSLVGSVAWGPASVDQPTSSGDALATSYTIDLHNLGNGSDTFTIVDGTTESSVNLTAGSFATTPDENGGIAGVQITLFGTISSGAGVYDGTTNTTIPVSYLTVADLVDGVTTVIINATIYTVAAGSTGTSLVVAGDASGDVVGAGVQIGENAAVTYNGTVGTLSGGTDTATHDHSLTATGLALDGNTAATANVTWSTTVNNAVMTVTKYVRNVGNANGNPGAGGTIVNGGSTYYTANVTGNPGDTLEYAIVVQNAGSGRGTDVIVTDTFPQFTAYVASSVSVDTNGDNTYDHTLGAGDTEASNEVGGIVETDTGAAAGATALKVYAGTGGGEGAVYGAGTGGEVAGGSTSVILYQLTIQ